jgi:hypothetical protein
MITCPTYALPHIHKLGERDRQYLTTMLQDRSRGVLCRERLDPPTDEEWRRMILPEGRHRMEEAGRFVRSGVVYAVRAGSDASPHYSHAKKESCAANEGR